MNDITKKLQKMVKSKKTPNVVTKCGTGKYVRKSRSSTSVESYISFNTSNR